MFLPAPKENKSGENCTQTLINPITSISEKESYHIDNKQDVNLHSQGIINKKSLIGEGFCYYLGIMLLAPYFSQVIQNGIDFILQWLISVLLGSINIEQTKTLNFSALNILLGSTIKNRKPQRKALKELSSCTNINKLLKFNIDIVGIEGQTDFYYDPHSKHYTGLRNILKGWCAKIKQAGKAIYMDFIHSENGFPLYMNIVDNYDDMRIRFFRDVENFRTIANISKEKVLTFVIDRAIYSQEVFEYMIKLTNTHIITWEKDYKHDKWQKNAVTKTGYIKRKRNKSTDYRLIKYHYQDRIWDKNQNIRQLIVRIPTPDGTDHIEVSILTDDLTRMAVEIINLMFNRWVQENDFKYIIKHFGIDQITTYDYLDYADIKDQIEDKQHISGKYKAITREIDNLRKKLKTTLFRLHRLEQAGLKKKLTKKQTERQQELEEEKVKSDRELRDKEKERNNLERKVSKIDELIKEKKQKLDTNTKYFFDVIKIIGRNIFYLTFSDFKQKYNNYRDDLVIFQQLTRANGVIKIIDGQIIFDIYPEMELTPKIKKVFSEIIEEINQKHPELPDGSRRKIKLNLAGKIDSLFAFAS